MCLPVFEKFALDFQAVYCPVRRCNVYNGIGVCGSNKLEYANNPLCAKCLNESFQVWGNQCVECNSADVGLLILYFVSSFLFLCLLRLSAQSSSGGTMVTHTKEHA